MKKENVHGVNYKYPSVTTILGVLRKPNLEWWFKINTPEFIETETEKAKAIGTAIHEAIFNHIEKTGLDTETQYPDEVSICIKSFLKFKKEHPEIKLAQAELQIEHSKLKYSGTLDCIAKINNIPIILDWKSNKKKLKIYNEHYYQLAAYMEAYEFQHNIEIKKGIIVEIGKDNIGYNLGILENKKLEKAFKIFKHALSIYYLQKEHKIK